MICEKCKLNTARIHVVKILKGKKISMNLCEQCALLYENIVIDPSGGKKINNFVSNLYEAIHGNQSIGTSGVKTIKCEKCGLSLDGFRKSGRLGCSHCYEVFKGNLDVVLEKVQGKNVHIGKIPQRTGGELKTKNEILCLKKELKDRIKKEEFEEAAILRDKIKILEKSLVGGEMNEGK